MGSPPTLNYSTSPLRDKKFRHALLTCRILCAFALLTLGVLEIFNAGSGFLLPMPDAPPGFRNNWRVSSTAESYLRDLVAASCFLYPLVAGLLIAMPILAWKAPTRRLRINILVAFLLMAIAISLMIYRGYWTAFGRSLD